MDTVDLVQARGRSIYGAEEARAYVEDTANGIGFCVTTVDEHVVRM